MLGPTLCVVFGTLRAPVAIMVSVAALRYYLYLIAATSAKNIRQKQPRKVRQTLWLPILYTLYADCQYPSTLCDAVFSLKICPKVGYIAC